MVDVAVSLHPLHVAVGVGGEWIHSLAVTGGVRMTSYLAEEFIEQDQPFIFPVPVLNGQAVLDTVGSAASNCFTGACQALINGWLK
jgi:hypothetical protein